MEPFNLPKTVRDERWGESETVWFSDIAAWRPHGGLLNLPDCWTNGRGCLAGTDSLQTVVIPSCKRTSSKIESIRGLRVSWRSQHSLSIWVITRYGLLYFLQFEWIYASKRCQMTCCASPISERGMQESLQRSSPSLYFRTSHSCDMIVDRKISTLN